MNYVERYRKSLYHTYNIYTSKAPERDAEVALQTAVKSINDSAGPDSLVPTLLVYCALPRLGLLTDVSTPSTYHCSIALRKAAE